nr:amino acid ABC transporter permease [Anaerolineae bacterium]
MTSETNDLGPPRPPAPLEWARQNLFRTWYDALLTVLSLGLLYVAIRDALRWILVTADWSPVSENFMLYLVGQFPREEIWRVGLSVAMLSLLLGI